MSVKISEAFPSPYLKCADLGGKPWVMKIRAVVMEDLGQGNDKEAKAVVYFESAKKGFVLNRTNANAIKAAYGDDTSNQNNVKGAHYAVYKAACGFLNVKRSYMTPRSALYVPEEGSRALNSPKNKLWGSFAVAELELKTTPWGSI